MTVCGHVHTSTAMRELFACCNAFQPDVKPSPTSRRHIPILIRPCDSPKRKCKPLDSLTGVADLFCCFQAKKAAADLQEESMLRASAAEAELRLRQQLGSVGWRA